MGKYVKKAICRFLVLALLINISLIGAAPKTAYAAVPNTISINSDPFGGSYRTYPYDVDTQDFGTVTFKGTDDGLGVPFGALTWMAGQGMAHAGWYTGDNSWNGIMLSAEGSDYTTGIWFVFGTQNGSRKFSFLSFKVGEYFGVSNTIEVIGLRDGSQVASQEVDFTAASPPNQNITMNGNFGYVDEIRMRQKTEGMYNGGYPGFEGIVVNDFVLGDPVIVEFSNTSYSTAEDSGSAVLTVNRTGGSVGTVTIDYTTADGTAEAGSDYTAVSGTLTFGDSVTSKEITIPIADDFICDGNKNLSVVLKNPTGGAILGSKYTATLTIEDNEHLLNYSAGANGSIIGETSQIVAHGSSGTEVTAVADTGYHFTGWSDGVTTPSRTDADVTGNKSVTANFSINEYTLTYTAGANGSITGEASQTVAHGSSGTEVTAVADTGYHFTGWSDGVTTPSRTDADVTGNINVTANFAVNEYTLTYSAGGHGTISGAALQTVSHGNSGTEVTAVPAEGCHFAGWSDGVTTPSRTDTNVTGDINTTANFAANEYTLTYSAGEHGTISGAASQAVSHGNSGTEVEAVPAEGYHFAGWSDGVTTSKRTDDNVAGNKNVTAHFAINEYTLSYIAGPNGSIAGFISQTVTHGSNGYLVTALPNPGYHFTGWSDGVITPSRTDNNVMENINVTAHFVVNQFTLDYIAGANGSIAGAAHQVVNQGTSGTMVTAVPNPGYHFVNWSDGVTTPGRTDTNVTGNINATAYFAVNEYTLTYAAGDHGLINGTTTQTVVYGNSGIEVEAVPAEGYHFTGWSDGLTTAKRTDSNVTGNLSVTADFAVNVYTVSFNTNGGSTVDGQDINYGSKAIKPSKDPARTGYSFAGWYKDAECKTEFIFDSGIIASNTTIFAKWTANTYIVTFDAEGGTVGTASQKKLFGSTYGKGADGASDEALPVPTKAGYDFEGWYDGDNGTGNLITETTAVTAAKDHTLYAKWKYIQSTHSGGSTGGTTSNTVTGSVIDDATGGQVSNIEAVVTTGRDGNISISMNASEAVVLKSPDGSAGRIRDISKVAIVTAAGAAVPITSDGKIKAENLAKGTDNRFDITYDLGNGQRITMGAIDIKIGSNGEVSLTTTLIDPYGTITDRTSGKPVEGVKLMLYYANTGRNKSEGKIPDTLVQLPIIEGFEPNDNKNPQVSDTLGAYAFMVFPDTDYYIVAEKDGYLRYTSPIIPVGKDIVKWDFDMRAAKMPERIYGQDRIDTALEIAKASFKDTLSDVILATSENYPDALAGSVLAYKLDAPILLVGNTEYDQSRVISYIKGNMKSEGNVYILGGTGAVGSGMEDKLKESGFKNIKRLGGLDRYETSVKISEEVGIKEGTPVIIVSGENYPDALSVSSAAAVRQYPILLAERKGISDSVKKELLKIKPGKVYIIGLQGVVNTEIEEEISQFLSMDKADITRIGGKDRFETSLEVVKEFNLPGNIICAATGNAFPDALAGSVYAAKLNAPIILVDKYLSDDVINYLNSREIYGIDIFGGEGAVNRDIEEQLAKILKQQAGSLNGFQY